VSIPVRLYPATEDRAPHFRHLHRDCGTPMKYLKWCPRCDRKLEPEDVIRGYQYQRGRFVPVSDEDLRHLPLPTARRIDILQFVPLREVDPIYYHKPYFIAPGQGGERAYVLLLRVLRDLSVGALAKVALRAREWLATIRPYRRVLVLETMQFADEVRSPDAVPGVPDEDIAVTGPEMETARMLVEALCGSFRPEQYRSEYRRALDELVRRKVEGREFVQPEEAPPVAVPDLLEALQVSLAQLQRKEAPGGGSKDSSQGG